MKDIIEDWLRAALLKLDGKRVSIQEILNLSDALEALETAWGFTMKTDIWISFKSEEADVVVQVGDREFPISVCLVSIPWKFQRF